MPAQPHLGVEMCTLQTFASTSRESCHFGGSVLDASSTVRRRSGSVRSYTLLLTLDLCSPIRRCAAIWRADCFYTAESAQSAHKWQSGGGEVRRSPGLLQAFLPFFSDKRVFRRKCFAMSTATKTAKKKPASTNLKLQPLGDRVVLEREESEQTTAGGIVLPDTAKNKPARGTIVAVGDGRLLENGQRGQFQVKVGDRVLFSSYAGDEFKVGDQELLLMREDDILAVIEG
jgi:chaperonin GroES